MVERGPWRASSSGGHQMQAACSTFCRGSALQAFKPAGQQRQQRAGLVVRASKLAEPAALPVKTLSGSDAGEASIALRVAEEDTATGLVHRYLTTVMRNARQVRATNAWAANWEGVWARWVGAAAAATAGSLCRPAAPHSPMLLPCCRARLAP